MVSGGVEYYEDGILDDRWISTWNTVIKQITLNQVSVTHMLDVAAR